MLNLKYSEILKLNKKLSLSITDNIISITVLSNIVVHYIKDILEYSLRINGVNATVTIGDYDNIVQNSNDEKLNKADIVLILWEASNFIDGFQYKVESMNDSEIATLNNKIRNEIELTMRGLKKNSLVLFNSFSSTLFTYYNLREGKFEKFVNSLNDYLQKNCPSNFHIISIESIFYDISVKESCNMRDYFSSKCLYTVNFFKSYSEYISPYIYSLTGKAKKALILDCDNTLWEGILGEDGIDGIKMSSFGKATAYEYVQYLIKNLAAKGVIIGLCTKNNETDVTTVIEEHPDFRLSGSEIVIKLINWDDKVTNLQRIGEKLNIGLDSIVFVDDSEFEVENIRSRLPQVKVLKVPIDEISKYPELIQKANSFFFNLSVTNEDFTKISNYKTELRRKEELQNFGSIEEYINSLSLQIDIFVNHRHLIPRISQMTQKTNQFNLTTKRYSEQDILNFIDNGESVIALNVKDRFGDSGITGLSIVVYRGNNAIIDSLLLSCRILGRNIEYALLDFVVEHIFKKGYAKIESTYIPTQKNIQVVNFYDKLGFALETKTDSKTEYSIDRNSYKFHEKKSMIVTINE